MERRLIEKKKRERKEGKKEGMERWSSGAGKMRGETLRKGSERRF